MSREVRGPDAATETLEGRKPNPTCGASIYDPRGNLFAFYAAGGGWSSLRRRGPNGLSFLPGSLVGPLDHSRKEWAGLIRASLAQLKSGSAASRHPADSVSRSLLVAMAITAHFQRRSRVRAAPRGQARIVSGTGQFDPRRSGRRRVGLLIRTFNEMPADPGGQGALGATRFDRAGRTADGLWPGTTANGKVLDRLGSRPLVRGVEFSGSSTR